MKRQRLFCRSAAVAVRNGPTKDLIDIFNSATRFGGNDFEIVEFCLCFGSEAYERPELRSRRRIRNHDRGLPDS
jgi:hypothetical protein